MSTSFALCADAVVDGLLLVLLPVLLISPDAVLSAEPPLFQAD